MNIVADTNRLELFERWYIWSIHFKDCDPSIWLLNYLFRRYELNIEQRYWFCWLYANTYHVATAWLLINEFPDFELVTTDRIDKWNTANYSRLRYQTDTKYNKGHLPKMFESYKQFLGEYNQHELLGNGDTPPKEHFTLLWLMVNKDMYKFGRYTTWFYLQSLKHCCGVNLEPWSLFLSDYSGSRSHRNGLLFALGMDSLVDQKLTMEQYEELEEFALDFVKRLRIKYPAYAQEIDFFTLETCLCSFKKVFRERNGRYLGYYLDRQSEEILKIEQDGWYGVDWNVLWAARQETLDPRLCGKNKVDKTKFSYYLQNNQFERIDWLFPTNPIGVEKFI